MKKVIIAGAVALIAAGGAWFGIPVYAEGEFKGALDGYFATKTDDRAGYKAAQLDYWNDRAEIGAVSDVVTVKIAGKELKGLLTVNDLIIEGYDLDAANTALAGADGKVEHIAQRVSWSGFTLTDEANGGALTGKAGSLANVKADKLDLKDIFETVGAEFSSAEQAGINFEWSKDTETLKASLATLSAENGASSGIGALTASDIKFRSAFAKDEVSGDIAMDWGDLAITGMAFSELLSVARFENRNAKITFNITGPSKRGREPQDVTGEIGFETYILENGDVHMAMFDIYPALITLFEQAENEETGPEEFAQIIEMIVAGLENAVKHNTGADSFVMTNLVTDIPMLQRQTIERVEAKDNRGLKLARFEMIGMTQTTPMGSKTSVDQMINEDIDLSALPAYLRKVFGAKVTPESPPHAEAFYRENTIAAAIPAISFGRWTIKNQVIELPDATVIKIGDVTMTPMLADENGAVQFATSLAGITLPLEQIAQKDPRAGMALGMLKSQGIEQINLGYGIDLTASPKAGTVDITDISVALEKLGALSIKGDISGIDVEKMRTLPEQEWSVPLMEAGVGGVTIVVKDEGLLDFAFNMLASQQGAKPEQIAAGLAMQAEQMSAQFGSPRATALGQAVAAFMRDGGSITVTMAKTEPTPAMEIMMTVQTQGPPAVLDLLQIEAVHTP
jgi:hypothetical protein